MPNLKAYLTNGGLKLLNQCTMTQQALRISAARLGSGRLECENEQERAQKAAALTYMLDARMNATVARSGFEDSVLRVTVQVESKDVSKELYVWEIGLFAPNSQGAEVLLCYATFVDSPDWIPMESVAQYVRNYDIGISIGMQNMALSTAPSALVRMEDFSSHIGMENPHHITKEQLGIKDIDDVPQLGELLQQIDGMKSATSKADEATGALSTLMETADARIPAMADLNDYSYAIIDDQQKLGMGIKKDGTFVIPKADNYPVGEDAIMAGDTSGDNLAYALLDKNNALSELTVGADGKFPNWVLERWKKRMNMPEKAEIGGQIDEVKAAAAAAHEAADEVNERLEEANQRIPVDADMEDYSYAVIDNRQQLGVGLKKDGSFVIAKANAYPLGPDELTSEEVPGNSLAYAVLDKHNACSELVIGADGKFPDWVLQRWKARMQPPPERKKIICWGDSLTVGAGGNGTTYRGVLQNALDASGYTYDVMNGGVGGEGAMQIAARQGVYPVVVNHITIPPDTKSIKIGDENTKLTLSTGGTVTLMRQGTAMINPCSIAGVTGTLTIVQDSFSSPLFSYYFARDAPGKEVCVTRPAYIRFDGWNYDDYPAVIWVGTNNVNSTAEEIIAVQEAMADRLTHKQYLIVGLTSKAYHADVAEKNSAMLKRWGRRFFDLRQYLLDYGLADAQITPAAADVAAIEDGEIPPALLSDTVHFNAAGYRVIGEAVFTRLVEEAYITK